MEHLIFALYLVLFAWLVTRTPFFTRSGIARPQLVILFLLKVTAGILYGWMGVYYGDMGQTQDSWSYHFESLQEYELLRSDPGAFFTSIFHNGYQEGYLRFLASESSWWNDLKGTIFVKLLAVCNLASFGHYYVNVIFYAFISLFGAVAMYRVMRDLFPAQPLAVLLSSFLVPSFLYWTSGVHKDGLIFLGIALVAYTLYFGLKENRFTLLRGLLFFCGLLLVLTLRNFLIIPLFPALVAWLLSSRLKAKPLRVYAGVYALFLLLFFAGKHIHPRLNFPEEVVSRQQAFLGLLGGNSAVEVERLQPSATSFLATLPQALTLSTIRPFPSDVRHLLSFAAAAEVFGLLVLCLAGFLVWRGSMKENPFLLFCLFFSFSVLLMIGYSVNILGAIVRYRSIVFPLLLVPIVAQANWQKFAEFTGFTPSMAKK